MLQLGLAEKARGNLDTASDWLERACVREPESAVARFYYGEVLYNRGLNAPALAALTEAIARNPEYAEAHYLLAFVHGDMGQHEAAREATRQAIKLNPTLARAQANLALEQSRGTGQRRNGERGKAASAAEVQVVEGGRSPTTTSGSRSGRRATSTEAIAEYRLALEAGEDRPAQPPGPRGGSPAPARPGCRARPVRPPGRATMPIRPSSGTSAASACTRPDDAPRRSPPTSRRSPSIPATSSRGTISAWRAHETAGDDRRRIRAASRRSTRAPPLLAARLNLGLLLLQRRRSRQSLEEYQRALAEQPGSAVGWNGIGLVLMELRRYEDARNAFGRAVDADAAFAAARYNLSFVLSQLGDFDGALRETSRRSSSNRSTCRRSSR